jgi:nucleotide-binding universal stress UspA family protein
MKKILVPTDFSEIANKAVAVAVDIAKKSDAAIELININMFPANDIGTYYSIYSASMGSIDDAWEGILEDAKHKMDGYIDLYPGVNIKPFVLETEKDFVKELIEHYADLIVMGSHGADGLKELLRGSNSEEVVRLASCPVLVVKENLTNDFDPKKVVFAVDLSKHHDFIKQALYNLPINDAEKHFIYIDTDMKAINYAETKKMMQELAVELHINNSFFEIYEAVKVEIGILEYAQQINADLIVMYTHGRTGINHFFRGSIAENVVNHSKVPVFTFVEN